jgi:hypothetical protein
LHRKIEEEVLKINKLGLVFFGKPVAFCGNRTRQEPAKASIFVIRAEPHKAGVGVGDGARR